MDTHNFINAHDLRINKYSSIDPYIITITVSESTNITNFLNSKTLISSDFPPLLICG